MKIQLKRQDKAYLMKATNEKGNFVISDGSPKIGGSEMGMSPMEMLISSLGGCSSIDVIHFLKKFKQPLEHIEIEIEAEQDPDHYPSLFTNIHIHYQFWGDMNPQKIEKAIRLSVEKYCPIARTIEKTAEISWSYELN